MPSEKGKGGLSVILGLGGPKSDEDRPNPKRMAAEAMMDAVKGSDVDLFMSALDDYLGYRMEPEE